MNACGCQSAQKKKKSDYKALVQILGYVAGKLKKYSLLARCAHFCFS